MTTGLGIVTKALQKAGVVTKSETIGNDEASDGLDALNALVSSWANDSMLISSRSWESFTLTAGDAQYSIGTSQDFNTSRPVYIADAYVRQDTIDYPISIIPDEVYSSSIATKTDRGAPRFLNYDNGYPTGNIRLYPVPDTIYTLHLLLEKPLSSFTLSGDVSLPPGWERALIFNLAVEISAEYGQQIDPLVYKIAQESKSAIKVAIIKNRSMDSQPESIGSRSNIYSGGFN